MRWLVAMVAACAAPVATPQLDNRAAAPQTAQLLRPLVVDDSEACAPHRVTISLDGAPVATVGVTCPAPPPVLASHVTVIESDSWREFEGAPVAVTPGQHTLSVRDDLNGQTASVTKMFPADGRSQPPRPADSIVVIDNAVLRIDVAVRAMLVFL